MQADFRLNRVLCIAVLYGLTVSVPAYGYIDPTAQGLLSQILTPILMIAATGVTFFRKQVGSAMRRMGSLFRRPEGDGAE